MEGNAAEWAGDEFRINPAKYDDLFVPHKKNASINYSELHDNKTVNGGSWYDGPFYMQPCVRQKYPINKCSERVGFRVVITDLQR